MGDIEADSDYCKRAKTIVDKSTNGRMIYRPSVTAPLGVVDQKLGTTPDASANSPQWTIAKALDSWAREEDVRTWCEQRGLSNVTSIARLSRKKLLFEGRWKAPRNKQLSNSVAVSSWL